jgi:hypothetical protein
MSRTRSACGRRWASAARAGCCLLPLAACGCSLPAPDARPPLLLIEKGRAQSIYDSKGRLQRVLVDADGDQRAETQALYGPDGKLLAAELDTDRDGIVDRWERFDADGALERVGRSLRSRARPDVWEYPDPLGGLARREFDDDGDGRADRVEPGPGEASAGSLEELDTDGDGKPDRRLLRTRAGAIIAVEIDRDQDGVWERREPVRPR